MRAASVIALIYLFRVQRRRVGNTRIHTSMWRSWLIYETRIDRGRQFAFVVSARKLKSIGDGSRRGWLP